MKIHEKDPASGLLPVSPPSPTKRRRPSVKRRQEEDYEEPPTKKVKDGAEERQVVSEGPSDVPGGSKVIQTGQRYSQRLRS